ncbi:MAG: hypothetical protein B6242_05925 [Anaerolineaceae bacterium 4572_78]|nr:MAG: hypothetical protein B6242_05925 [Anaerolineaceae bacterium 4572_78]
MSQEDIIFADIFPIKTDILPQLFAYSLQASDKELYKIGGKLPYRLKSYFGKQWAWTSGIIVSTMYQDKIQLHEFLQNLWQNKPDPFQNLHEIIPITDWQATPKAMADFVSNGMLRNSKITEKIRRVLRKNSVNLANASIERDYTIRGLVVQGQPAVSISVFSNMLYKKDLNQHVCTIAQPDEIIGMWVQVKIQHFKGEIIKIVGTVAEHSERLLHSSRDPKMQRLIQQAADDELVVKIKTGQKEYDYVASALKIVLKFEYLSRFGLDSQQVVKQIRLSPHDRYKLVHEISQSIKKDMKSYNSENNPELFLCGHDIDFNPKIRLGNNQVFEWQEKKLWAYLKKHGLYKQADTFKKEPIKIGFIDVRRNQQKTIFYKRLRHELKTLNFNIELIGSEKLPTPSRLQFEKEIDHLEEKEPHILLALLPDENLDDESEGLGYTSFKSITIGRGIPSQAIFESTLSNEWAVANVIMGILGKIGNIPFALAEPLPYTDMVVGLDVARDKKKNLAGSRNAAAVARIYVNSGEFMHYAIEDMLLEGETIPARTLQNLFPVNQFEGKRVIIHRDGRLQRDERKTLKDWAEKIGATFYFVEVLKSGSPRLYLKSQNQVGQTTKGTLFKINDHEAFLVSSLPPFQNVTPQPLHVRTEPPFTIEQAIHSILVLVVSNHHGVTVHYTRSSSANDFVDESVIFDILEG